MERKSDLWSFLESSMSLIFEAICYQFYISLDLNNSLLQSPLTPWTLNSTRKLCSLHLSMITTQHSLMELPLHCLNLQTPYPPFILITLFGIVASQTTIFSSRRRHTRLSCDWS